MKREMHINVIPLFIIYLLFSAALIFTHTYNAYNGIALFVYLSCFYLLGAVILIPVSVVGLFLPITQAALSIFIGALVFSMTVFFSVNTALLTVLLLMLIFLLLIIFRKDIQWSLKIDMPSVIAFLIAIAVIFLISNDGDLSKQFTAFQDGTTCYTMDRYFFNTIVVSIRHGSIFSASFEVGSPLNYQTLGFFIPALFANLLHVSSHQALWGLALPFYKLLVILLGYELCFFYLGKRVSRTNYWVIVLSMALPILMAPLNPAYIAKGAVKDFIFSGMGYLVPAGTIAYPFTIILLLLCFLLFLKADWKNKNITSDKIYFSVLLSLMVIGKVPLYTSFMVFLGCVVLKRIIAGKERVANYLGYFLGSVFVSALLFKICLAQQSGGRNYFQYGYIADMFARWFGRSSSGIGNNIIILCLILLTYFLWLGIRMLGLATIFRSKDKRLNELFLGVPLTLVLITILSSFLHLEVVDGSGHVIQDNTFNMDQFIRSAFYMATIVSTIGTLYLFYSNEFNKKNLRYFYAITSVWCGLSLACIIFNVLYRQKTCAPIAWYQDNYNELKTGKYSNGLITTNPDVEYTLTLASSDYGTYWTCAGEGQGIKNEYRWHIFRDLVDSVKENSLIRMRNEGVKFIISTPVDSARFVHISALYPQYIHKVVGTKWIYEIW